MKVPPTIRKIIESMPFYAYKAGFTLHPNEDGTFSLFSIRAHYYVCRSDENRVARFILDELWIKYHEYCLGSSLCDTDGPADNCECIKCATYNTY